MNRDLVLEGQGAHLLDRMGISAPPLVETPISDAMASRAAAVVQSLGAKIYLGGSAFNAARVAALLNSDRQLDLTFFGIAGTTEVGPQHRLALDNWQVDCTMVNVSALPPATCLSIIEPAGRTLLTASGANAGIVDWLTRNSRRLAETVSRCTVLHVTSFLDPAAADAIADLLDEARIRNPHLIVSLDPGMAWITPGGPGLERLLGQTRILHLNHEEFSYFSGSGHASDIGKHLARDWMIVARRHEGATLFSAHSRLDLPAMALPNPADIVDATGAGDTFCGAFLWSWCQDQQQPLRAAALGFALARQKVGIEGPLAMSESVRRAVLTHLR